ncbi:hypothetical protein D9756_011064 [Leucocoprinus leucothites]|uniref:DUF6533 domain-containing protein n=1 Tax=Leucocoprinus leucothites TaxID=201217 RepID=A0A8H5CN67_9AGAR|nr:hypothetical protein D9756_011064 [Leucoagaricus leucothites]
MPISRLLGVVTMSDPYGLTRGDYIMDREFMQLNTYIQIIAITVLGYDTIYLIPQEVKYIYRGAWTRIRAIYVIIRLCVWFHLIVEFYTWTNNFLSKPVRFCELVIVIVLSLITHYSAIQRCTIAYSDINIIVINLIIPVTMKILLVLRLRAAWNNNRIVTIILYTLTAAEAITGVISVVVHSLFHSNFTLVDYPLHGCWLGSDSDLPPPLFDVMEKVAGTFVGVRGVSALIETLLTVVRFGITYRDAKATGSTIQERLSHIQLFTPLLYVFYRDGTLLLIPILALSIVETISKFDLLPQTTTSMKFLSTDWAVWVDVIYSMIVMCAPDPQCSPGKLRAWGELAFEAGAFDAVSSYLISKRGGFVGLRVVAA